MYSRDNEDHQGVENERYWPAWNQMSSCYNVCFKEWQVDTILRLLMEPNPVTVRDFYTLPRMDECFDVLGEALIFSTFEAHRSYLQIKMDDANRGN